VLSLPAPLLEPAVSAGGRPVDRLELLAADEAVPPDPVVRVEREVPLEP